MSPSRMIAAVPAVFCLMVLGWNGCTDCSAEEAQAKAAAAPAAGGLASQDAGSTDRDRVFVTRRLVPYYERREWFVETGETDERNRYLSAVEVRERELEPRNDDRDMARHCTGVLVSPRLVLTAASCVCSPIQMAQIDGGQPLVNGNACATAASVKTMTYIRRPQNALLGGRTARSEGAVRVHPAFKQVIDERGNVVSSEADLAVIVLDDFADIPPIELAGTDVKTGEALVIVGYGDFRATGWERRFSEHPVTEMLNSGGRVGFAQPPHSPYKGARGGPCLRQTGQGIRLAGILSASVGQEAWFTSAYPYREWLRAEIQSAADAGLPTRPASP